jgi:hypothetical protein
MKIKSRQQLSPRTRPSGSDLETLRATTWESVEDIWAAIERLETNSLMLFETITLSGDWVNASGGRIAAARYIASDTLVLRGVLENSTSMAHTSQIGTLPPASWPRFETHVLAHAVDTVTVIPVSLTIAVDGDITPTWAAAPTGAYQLILDNILVHLA